MAVTWGAVFRISLLLLLLAAIATAFITLPFERLGGGYLFGLPVGFVADSIGATIGAVAAFILGRTVVIILGLVVSVILMVCYQSRKVIFGESTG